MRQFVVFVFVLANHVVISQTVILDSLKEKLRNHPNEDSIKANLLNQLSFRILKNQPPKALEYAESALKLSDKLHFQKGIGESKINLAAFYLFDGKADNALKTGLEAARIAEKQNLIELMASSYATLGSIYQNQLNFDVAFQYLEKSRRITKNPLTLSKIFMGEGGIARKRKKFDSALYYYQRVIDIMKETNDDYRTSEAYYNIGVVYLKDDKESLAMEYYQKALISARSSGNRRAEGIALGYIGDQLVFQKKYKEAEAIFVQTLAFGKELNDTKLLKDSYMELIELKNQQGKFDESHFYMKNYYQLKDSLVNIERANKIAELQILYDTEKKEHDIQILNHEKQNELIWKNIYMAGFVLSIITLILIYYVQRMRAHKNQELLNLKIDLLTAEHYEISEKYKNVITTGTKVSVESIDQRLLKRTMLVVESNMADPSFSVEKMAQEMGMSRTNMHRKIKSITGFSPSELIRSIRLRRAASLLVDQADSVSQISFAVGFEDHSYFSKAFKKQFGVPPSEYLNSVSPTEAVTA